MTEVKGSPRGPRETAGRPAVAVSLVTWWWLDWGWGWGGGTRFQGVLKVEPGGYAGGWGVRSVPEREKGVKESEVLGLKPDTWGGLRGTGFRQGQDGIPFGACQV